MKHTAFVSGAVYERNGAGGEIIQGTLIGCQQFPNGTRVGKIHSANYSPEKVIENSSLDAWRLVSRPVPIELYEALCYLVRHADGLVMLMKELPKARRDLAAAQASADTDTDTDNDDDDDDEEEGEIDNELREESHPLLDNLDTGGPASLAPEPTRAASDPPPRMVADHQPENALMQAFNARQAALAEVSSTNAPTIPVPPAKPSDSVRSRRKVGV